MRLKLPRPRGMKKRTGKPPKGYDSWFEADLHQKQLRGCEHHQGVIEYVQVRKYEPDFIRTEKNGDKVYIEAKGRFRDRAEARKYLDVRKALGSRQRIVFVFQNKQTPMPGARKRLDGTKLTHGEWAELNFFEYYTPETLPAGWGKR